MGHSRGNVLHVKYRQFLKKKQNFTQTALVLCVLSWKNQIETRRHFRLLQERKLETQFQF